MVVSTTFTETNDHFSVAAPPQRFMCRLGNEMMTDPVTTPNGYVFELTTVLKWLQTHSGTCPISEDSLTPSDLKADDFLQWEIMYWQRKKENGLSPLQLCRNSASSSLAPPQDRRSVDKAPSMPYPSPETVVRKRFDSPPSVPRRIGSDADLRATYELEVVVLVCKAKLGGPNTAEHLQPNLIDIVRGPLAISSATEAEDSSPVDLVSIIHEVESTLADPNILC
jgi:hypothetical protein